MKKTTKRGLAILLCCVLLLALAACGKKDGGAAATTPPAGGGSTPAPGESPAAPDAPAVSTKDTLNIAVSGDNGTLDPRGISGVGGFMNISRMYGEPLWDNNAKMEKIWVLAESLEEDTTHWVIHLRKGVTFSNGNPFNADDVLFTLNLYANDPMGFMYIPTLNMSGAKKLDDYTVEIPLDHYEITQIDGLTMLFMFDGESFDEEAYTTNPIGTGPYTVAEYVIGSHCNLVANPTYWGKEPAIKKLNFKVLSEDAQRVNSLEVGTVDVSSIPTTEAEYVSTIPGYRVETIYSGLCNNILFNTTPASVFNNQDARLAVAYALDREAIVNLVFSGYAEITDYPVSMSAIDFEPRLANLGNYAMGYDPALAKAYAEKGGLVGKDIRIVTNGATDYITTAELLQANLKDIGVNVLIQNYDQASYYDIGNDPNMFDISLYATASPQKLVVGMLYSYVLYSAILNAGDWAGYERFMELGRGVIGNPNAQERSDVVYEMTKIFVDACPWFGICDLQSATAFDQKLGGVEFYSNGDFRYNEWYWTE